MEQIFRNSEVVTLDEQIQPRHKLAHVISMAVAVGLVLLLAIPQAETQAPPPTPGEVARMALCGDGKP